MMTIGSLFSGIGGLELGLTRAGLGPVLWQVETNEFCRSVLARHWPNTRRYDDVRDVRGWNLEYVDVLCGGFPCQDLSNNHTSRARAGLNGQRSGLWSEFRRIIEELQPRAVVIENVAAWRRWLPTVRRDLHSIGYSSLSLRVCAADVAAPHKRARVFVVAYPHNESEPASAVHGQVVELSESASACWQDWGEPYPGALGVADGVSKRLDRQRLKALGNAVVPQCAYVIGHVVQGLLHQVSQ